MRVHEENHFPWEKNRERAWDDDVEMFGASKSESSFFHPQRGAIMCANWDFILLWCHIDVKKSFGKVLSVNILGFSNRMAWPKNVHWINQTSKVSQEVTTQYSLNYLSCTLLTTLFHLKWSSHFRHTFSLVHLRLKWQK